jgi:hypothetical protein
VDSNSLSSTLDGCIAARKGRRYWHIFPPPTDFVP